METPNKIYLEKDKETDKIHHLWGQSPVIHSGYEHIEYIRKDTLLEWLRKEYETISWYNEKMKHVTGFVGNTDSSGKIEAYKKVIDKIESL